MAAIGSIVAAALSNQLADEFKAWTPWLIKRLIGLAVSKLPEALTDRYKEEWASHVDEVPGQVGKLLVAAGRAMRAEYGADAFAQLTPLSSGLSFGLLPEPEARWHSFGVSVITNLIIVTLLVSLTAIVHQKETTKRGSHPHTVLRKTPLPSILR